MFFSYLNEANLDAEDITIQTSLPVYITLSTIPSRAENTFKIIRHMLKKVHGFEKIILNLPHKYNRFPNAKIDLSRYDDLLHDKRFVLNRTNDYGPLTKFMPTLSLVPDESILIVCDDMCYKLKAFKDIAELQDTHRNQSFTYYKYLYETSATPVWVPQGADLISFYTKSIQHFPKWFDEFLEHLKVSYYESPCFYVDDQVIGYFLQYYGIPLVQVDPDHRMIYIKHCDVSPSIHNLNRQTGKLSRDTTMQQCNQQLHKIFELSV